MPSSHHEARAVLPAKCSLYVFIALVILAIHAVEYILLSGTNSDHPNYYAIVSPGNGEPSLRRHRAWITDAAQTFSRYRMGERVCHTGVCYNDLLDVEPPILSTKYKNPCWYQEKTLQTSQAISGNAIARMTKHLNLPDGGQTFLKNIEQTWMERRGKARQLRCLPYFIIIGQPKSGSTDLYARLALHQQITLPSLKEPQWYSWKRFSVTHMKKQAKRHTYRELSETPLSDYVAIFDKQTDDIEKAFKQHNKQLVTGDGSSNLLYWNLDWELYEQASDTTDPQLPAYTLADHVKAVQPTVKLLAILRNPTDRLYSAYKYFPHKGNKSVEDFHADVVNNVALFRACRKQRNSRSCAYDRRLYYQLNLQIMTGLYSVYIQDWLKVFPKEQLKIVNFELYKNDMLHHIDDVIEFLGLDPLNVTSRKIVRSMRVHQVNPVKLGPMLEKTRIFLDKFYAPYNQQLAEILQDNTFNFVRGN